MANYCGKCLCAREYICSHCLGCEAGECCHCDPPGNEWDHIGSKMGKISLSRWIRGKQQTEREEARRVGVPSSEQDAGMLGKKR